MLIVFQHFKSLIFSGSIMCCKTLHWNEINEEVSEILVMQEYRINQRPLGIPSALS